jgi:hypothetical protein
MMGAPMRRPPRLDGSALHDGKRLSATALAAVAVAALAIVACKGSTPPHSAPSEERFELTPTRPLPSDSDDAAISENAPVALPSREQSEQEDEAHAGMRPLQVVDAGVVGDCPTQRKNLPSEIDITAEPRPRGIDAGALASEARFVLRNRRGVPRNIRVTGVDRLFSGPVRVSKVSFEEGGGGYPEATILLHANATAHLVVELDPPSSPPWRAHLEVDGVPICVEGPGKRPF